MRDDIIIVIEILNSIREYITDDSNFDWTSFDNSDQLNNEIDSLIFRFKEEDLTAFRDLYIHFLPTSTFQEHSLSNGWSERYMKLASQYDEVYERYAII